MKDTHSGLNDPKGNKSIIGIMVKYDIVNGLFFLLKIINKLANSVDPDETALWIYTVCIDICTVYRDERFKLRMYFRSVLGSSASSVKHYSETHIITNTVMKQNVFGRAYRGPRSFSYILGLGRYCALLGTIAT